MKRTFGQWLTALMTAMMLLLGAGIPTAASNAIAMPDLDASKSLSLTVHFSYTDEDETTALDGATMDLCRVADAAVSNGSVQYTLTEDFKDSGIDFEGMSASASNEAAAKLSDMVTSEVSTQSQVTDADGLAVFNDLTAGMYLVRETAASGTAEGYSRIEPFLAMVPGVNEEDGTWIYDVTVNPKTSVVKNDTPPETPETPPETPETPPETPDTTTTTDSSAFYTYATFVVHKTLDGGAPGSARFSFVLRDANGNTLQSVSNSADGTVSFRPIQYSNADLGKTFTYTISEVNDGNALYDYDSSVCTVTVNLRQTGDKSMASEIRYSGTTTFANTTKTEEEVSEEASTEVTTEEATEEEPEEGPGYDVPGQGTGSTSISVHKRWGDSDDRDGYRPSSISVQLYANGQAVGSAVTLSDANGWSFTWTALPDGAGYTVDETKVPEHYLKMIRGSAEEGYTILNGRDEDGTWRFEDESDDVWVVKDGVPTFEEGDSDVKTETSSSSPQTGDDMHLFLWILLLLAGGGALTGSILYRRWKNHR